MQQTKKRQVIIPAGGIGTRMGLSQPKQILPFRGKTVIEIVVDLFVGEAIVVAVPSDYLNAFQQRLGEQVTLICGGESRYASVRKAFEFLNPDPDSLVLIHDAARPFLDRSSLAGAWAFAAKHGAAIYAEAATDTIKQVNLDGTIESSLDREHIYAAQTPQIFRSDLLLQAYQAHDQRGGPDPTDEAALLERALIPVHIWRSRAENRKLTHKQDLALLEDKQYPNQMSIGHGYDVHRFDETRQLYLGGILIEGGPGLLGHSDADVVLHALMDAMLGAAGLGDIGLHFPDTAQEFKDIRSTVLLERVWQELQKRGWSLGNADITIQAQIPKLAPHLEAMRRTISAALSDARINLKATTTEGLGFVGQKQGIACDAVVLLKRQL